MKIPVLVTVIAIGLVTLGLSFIGLYSGAHLGKAFGRRVEILGGLILIGIGLRVVISHLSL